MKRMNYYSYKTICIFIYIFLKFLYVFIIHKDTEELNPILMICNQNADPSATYPFFLNINSFYILSIIKQHIIVKMPSLKRIIQWLQQKQNLELHMKIIVLSDLDF